ncbi:11814_t:CDS:2, partial [Racocetra persica]
SYHVYKNLEPSIFTKNLELSISTKNLEFLQNPLSIYDVLSFLDRDFLDDSGSNETSTEKPDDRIFAKRHKQITCKLYDSKYRNRSSISTIKRHFESNHKSVYQKYQNLSPPQIEHYGSCDEKKGFCVVEDKDFWVFIFELDPCYKLPSRQTISVYIWCIYEREREEL